MSCRKTDQYVSSWASAVLFSNLGASVEWRVGENYDSGCVLAVMEARRRSVQGGGAGQRRWRRGSVILAGGSLHVCLASPSRHLTGGVEGKGYNVHPHVPWLGGYRDITSVCTW